MKSTRTLLNFVMLCISQDNHWLVTGSSNNAATLLTRVET